ncbi:unnamed protein product [Paramecium pentaurelia]|uniref:TLC domain-containing protein n=1 Tax=Paramecium pentaurelia TaxID=43138 RepID=A0A8S1XCE7_9CILI|nr:unnamed protein product [Paramecium pentaurelia]
MNPILKSNGKSLVQKANFYYFRISNLSYEETFRLLFIILASILSFFVFDALRFRSYLIMTDVPVISYSNFSIMLLGLIIVHYSKWAVNYLCRDFVYRTISKQYQGEFRDVRVKKILKWLFDGVYYSTTSILCWYFFHEEPWYPNGLGGTNYTSIWQDFPNMINNKWVIPFYMIQTANHLYALIHLAIKRKEVETKYWEYMLHHTLATCLLIFSALYNQFRFGIVVLGIHDIADIILSLSRAQHDLKSIKSLMYIQYVLLLFTWIYTRVIIFPQIILEAIMHYQNYPEATWGNKYLIVQMCILFGMHLYWTYFMMQIGINVFKKGKKYEEINTYDNKEILKQGRN